SEVQSSFRAQGLTNVSVSVAPDRIIDGVATLNVFRTPVPQILVAGKRYRNFKDDGVVALQSIPLSNALATAVASSDTNAPAAKTNAVPHFPVLHYEITGDTLLTTDMLMTVLAKHTGTNMTIADILKAASELQLEYRSRGYPTVKVTLPQQQI